MESRFFLSLVEVFEGIHAGEYTTE
jgi:hypothetical protein